MLTFTDKKGLGILANTDRTDKNALKGKTQISETYLKIIGNFGKHIYFFGGGGHSGTWGKHRPTTLSRW